MQFDLETFRSEIADLVCPRCKRGGEKRCLRHEQELPGDEKLKEHHVIAWEHGGSDDADNLRVYCPACHGLVEWTRTYFGHYHPQLVA